MLNTCLKMGGGGLLAQGGSCSAASLALPHQRWTVAGCGKAGCETEGLNPSASLLLNIRGFRHFPLHWDHFRKVIVSQNHLCDLRRSSSDGSRDTCRWHVGHNFSTLHCPVVLLASQCLGPHADSVLVLFLHFASLPFCLRAGLT